MNIPLYLSAGFGELRPNHFHAGLDIKTRGHIGIPVHAVKDGYVSRIKIMPTGYGRVVFLNHPDGSMTVYGHLDHFVPFIENEVKQSQYRRQSFNVDLRFRPGQIKLKQGEIFAYSGDKGSSGGPHLHFEIRNADGSVYYDPLAVYSGWIKDTMSPEIRSVMFFPIPGEGVVDAKSKNVILPAEEKRGVYHLPGTVEAWGRIGLGIKAFDRMNGTSNFYGLKEVILKVNNKTLSRYRLDQFSVSESSEVNGIISWLDGTLHLKSFLDPGNFISCYKYLDNGGYLDIKKEGIYHIEYIVSDYYGNRSSIGFSIRGKKSFIPFYFPEGYLMKYGQDNFYAEKGLFMNIPRGNLYDDYYVKLDTLPTSSYSPIYRFGERIPLHAYCPFVFTLTRDIYPDKNRYGVVSLIKGVKRWVGGHYQAGKIYANVREISDFEVAVDDRAPYIRPVSLRRILKFRVWDDLSGINTWKGFLDGKFALFEYDAKNASMFCVFDPDHMTRGRHKLDLEVTDGAGNRAVYRGEVFL